MIKHHNITWRIRIVKLQTSLPVVYSSCTDRWWPLIHVYATTHQSNSYQVYIWSNIHWSHSHSSNRLIWELKGLWAKWRRCLWCCSFMTPYCYFTITRSSDKILGIMSPTTAPDNASMYSSLLICASNKSVELSVWNSNRETVCTNTEQPFTCGIPGLKTGRQLIHRLKFYLYQKNEFIFFEQAVIIKWLITPSSVIDL
jgi:hypothetical protein